MIKIFFLNSQSNKKNLLENSNNANKKMIEELIDLQSRWCYARY